MSSTCEQKVRANLVRVELHVTGHRDDIVTVALHQRFAEAGFVGSEAFGHAGAR